MRGIPARVESRLRSGVRYGLGGVALLLLMTRCGGSSSEKAGEAVRTTSSALLAPLWTSTGSMNASRQNHVAALLSSGSVLVAGGHPGNNTPTATAEVYNPSTQAWTAVGSMGTARRVFGACTLTSGKVLVAGGNAGLGDVASAELFDPTTNTWSATGSLAAAREDFSMTCLSDGRVLVAGGSGPSGLLGSAEVYNPSAGTWSSAGTMPAAVHTQGAVLLQDGRVLIAGGDNASGPVNTAAIWSPSTNAWTATGSMATSRAFHALTILADGRVLAAGGLLNVLLTTTNTAEIYNPTAGTWSAAAHLNTARYSGVSATLAAGPIVIGGVNGGPALASSESYDSVHNIWTQVTSAYGAVNQTATALSATSVLVAGGNTGSAATTSAQIYGVLNAFALYAQRSVTLGSSDQINGGDVGVAAATSTSFGAQLVVGSSATVQTNHNLVAPSVSLASGAHVGDVQTNSLTNSGGTLHTLAPYPPSMPAPPIAPPPGTGGSNVTVPASTTTTLNPGNYGALNVTGTAYLNAGAYTFSSVTLANQAHLAGVSGTATVAVTGTFQAGNSVSISSPGFAPAGQLIIAVAGYDSGSTPALSIGTGALMSALLSAPHGTLSIGASSTASGAFAGFDVKLGNNVTITYQSGFAAVAAHGKQQLSGYVTPAMAAAPLVGPVPPSTPIHLAIGLPMQQPATPLSTFIKQVSDPTSSSYRQYMTPTTFNSTYGAVQADYDKVVAFGNSNGLTVTQQYANHLLVDVSGPASAVEQAFYLNLNYYLRPDGTQFFGPDRNPSLDLATTVLRVSGTNNAFVPVGFLSGSGNSGNFSATDLRNAYVPCATNLTGSGQIVGLFSWGGFNPPDIATYQSTNGIASNPPSISFINLSGPNSASSTATPAETTLDIEMVNALAPAARVNVWEAPSNGDVGDSNDALFSMAATNPPNTLQFSSSWNLDSDDNTNQAMGQLAAQGQSFFESSGDTGAYPGGTNLTAYLPYLTVVGGTVLSMQNSTTAPCSQSTGPCSYGSETAWQLGGGGILNISPGVVPFFPYNQGGLPFPDVGLPSYQNGLANSMNQGSTVERMVPDVSTVAQNVAIFFNSGWQGVGGTSVSSPLWASFIALVNEQIVGLGFHGAVGFANPVLYAVGNAQQANPAGFSSDAFNDITTGNNDDGSGTKVYPAVTGYDLATGLGTPQCGLINQLASSSPTTPFSCGSGASICGLACCSGTCTNAVCIPPPTFKFNVASHVPQTFGPDVCFQGQGFTPGVLATITITGIPNGTPTASGTLTTSARVDGTGAFSGSVTSINGIYVMCSSSVAFGSVTVTATDGTTSTGTGRSVVGPMVPACEFCSGNQACGNGSGTFTCN
jgi:Pro-kumamolisin, activation domain/Galactose oxidase, central domain/Kelch motif